MFVCIVNDLIALNVNTAYKVITSLRLAPMPMIMIFIGRTFEVTHGTQVTEKNAQERERMRERKKVRNSSEKHEGKQANHFDTFAAYEITYVG